MIKVSVLPFVVVFILFSCKAKQEGHPSGIEVLKALGLAHDTFSLKALVKDIAETNVLHGAAVGLDGRRTEQWNRFDLLCSKATNAELYALTDDTNAVVRCYAFQAIAEKNYLEVYPTILCHLSDTATVQTLYGCKGGVEKVGDFMLDKVYSKCGQDGNRHLSSEQRATVDSLLIYGKDNRLNKRAQVLSRMSPEERYRVEVRLLKN